MRIPSLVMLLFLELMGVVHSHAQVYPDTVSFYFKKISDERTPVELRNGFTCCVQDKTGFIWFGSLNGLFRFDGKNYKAFHHIPLDSTTIGGQHIFGLKTDILGNIWIGGNGWISRLNPYNNKVRTWPVNWVDADGHESNQCRKFICDNHNSDWIWFPINSNKTLFGKFEVSSEKFSLVPLPRHEYGLKTYPVRFLELVQDTNGVLYEGRIGTVAIFNPRTGEQKIYYDTDPGCHFSLMCAGKENVTCLNDSFYIFSMASVSKKHIRNFSAHYINYGNCTQYENGNYLLSENNHGLLLFDKTSLEYIVVGSKETSWNELLQKGDFSIYRDYDQRIWLGCRGIFLLEQDMNNIKDLGPLLSIVKRNALHGSTFTHFLDSDHDKVYLFTGSKIYSFQPSERKPVLHELAIGPYQRNEAFISEVIKDPSIGCLFFMYDNYLCRFDPKAGTLKQFHLDFGRSFLGDRHELRTTTLLLDTIHHCCWGGDFWRGVFCIDLRNYSVRYFKYPEAFPFSDNIRPVAYTANKVFFLTNNTFCYYDYTDPGFVTISNPKLDRVDAGTFRYFESVQRGDQDLIITTPFGLFEYSLTRNTWKHYGSAEGLLIDEVHSVVLADSGNLVLGSSAGFFYYDVKRKISSEFPAPLNLPVNETVNLQTGSGGEMLIQCFGNLYYGHMNVFKGKTHGKTPVITSVEVYNREIAFDTITDLLSTIDLKHDQNLISIRYASLDYSFAERISYAYWLEGLNTGWTDAGDNMIVTFNNLAPRQYKFHLRSKGMSGIWKERLHPLLITIHPAFWQTWWFRLLALLFIGLMVYGLYRYRVRQLLKLLQVRNRIAQDLHDDVGSTLSSIRILSTMAEKDDNKAPETISKIRENAERMLENMSDIVWAVNPDNDTMMDVIARVNKYAAQVLEPLNVLYEVQYDDQVEKIPIEMQKRRDIYLICKESINNASKYAECTKLAIAILNRNRMLMVTIADNGKGLDTSLITPGNGLRNMEKRCRQMGASLSVQSSPGDGTCITVSIPW